MLLIVHLLDFVFKGCCNFLARTGCSRDIEIPMRAVESE